MPRGPLPWLIALEAAALLALAFFGWRLVTDRLASPPARPAVAGLASPHATPRPPAHTTVPPSLPAPAPSASAGSALPALSFDPAFWSRHLTQVNRDESVWEAVEWRVVQAVEAFARAYVEAVVMPAVENAAGRESA